MDCFHSGGLDYIVSGGADGRLCLWNALKGLPSPSPGVASLLFPPCSFPVLYVSLLIILSFSSLFIVLPFFKANVCNKFSFTTH
jgi:hypothetical protein